MIPLLAQLGVVATLLAAVVLYIVHQVLTGDDEAPIRSSRSLSSEEPLDPWWEQPGITSRFSMDGKCKVCGTCTSQKCSKCHAVQYCSVKCQRAHWRTHKYECSRYQTARQRSLAEQQADLKEAAALAAASAAAAAASPGAASGPPGQELAPVPQRVLCPYDVFIDLARGEPNVARVPPSLVNAGNSCYANSVIQCLLATRPLRNYLLSGRHEHECVKPSQSDWCLVCELQRIARVAAQGGMPTLRPLLRQLRTLNKSLAYGRQEDTHEFFYSLVNTMEAILLKEAGGKERFSLRTQETLLVNHVFGGYSRTQVVCCECRAVSRRYEHFMDVPIDIPADTEQLEDALNIYCQREVLDGDNKYQCDSCRRRVRAVRSVTLESAPNCLVLCLKRFGRTRFGKNNRKLEFGEDLDLAPFMDKEAMDQAPATYKLYSVIVHIDNMNSTTFGHYIAYVRSADGRWFMCDDDDVRPVPQAAVLRNNAYMLFYQRDSPKPAPNPHYRPPKAAPPPPGAAAAAAGRPTANGVAPGQAMNGHLPAAAAAAGLIATSQAAAAAAAASAGSGPSGSGGKAPPATAAGAAAAAAAEPDSSAGEAAAEGLGAAAGSGDSSGSGSAAGPGLPTLARVSTAPAALARLQVVQDPSSEDSDTAATPQQRPGAAAGAAAAGTARAASVPQQQQQRADEEEGDEEEQAATGSKSSTRAAPGDGGDSTTAAAAADAGGDASGRRAVEYTTSLRDGSRLVLRFRVPGVTSSSQVSMMATATELHLNAPGFDPVTVTLTEGVLPSGSRWVSGTGRLYRTKGLFKVCLQLGVGAAAAGQEQPDVLIHDSSSGLGGSSSGADSSSEGSDGEGWHQAHSLLHVATSEADLQSLLGRYANTRAKQLLSRLPGAAQQTADGDEQGAGQGLEQQGAGAAAGAGSKAGAKRSTKKGSGKKGKRK